MYLRYSIIHITISIYYSNTNFEMSIILTQIYTKKNDYLLESVLNIYIYLYLYTIVHIGFFYNSFDIIWKYCLSYRIFHIIFKFFGKFIYIFYWCIYVDILLRPDNSRWNTGHNMGMKSEIYNICSCRYYRVYYYYKYYNIIYNILT